MATAISLASRSNNYIFPAEGAYPYQRDLKDVEFHLLDTGHFALEEDGDAICASQQRFAIATYISQFLTSRLQPVPARSAPFMHAFSI